MPQTFSSKLELSKKDIEEIIMAHLRANDTKGFKYNGISFTVHDSTGHGDPYEPYYPARLEGATVSLEITL